MFVHKHFVSLNPPPLPTSEVMDFLLILYQKDLKQSREHSTKITIREQTLQKLRTNRIMNKRAFLILAHQNRTIAIASDFRVDGAKSPEIPPRKSRDFWGPRWTSQSQIANRKNRCDFGALSF